MQVHFIPVKIGVVWLADTFVETEGSIRPDFDAMGEDTELMQRWLSIE